MCLCSVAGGMNGVLVQCGWWHEWCACAVSVEGFKDLEASLANLFSKEGEVMTEGNEIECDECKQRVIVRRSLAPSYLPPMLWLNLKRFNYGMSNGQYQRVTCPILLFLFVPNSAISLARREQDRGRVREPVTEAEKRD